MGTAGNCLVGDPANGTHQVGYMTFSCKNEKQGISFLSLVVNFCQDQRKVWKKDNQKRVQDLCCLDYNFDLDRWSVENLVDTDLVLVCPPSHGVTLCPAIIMLGAPFYPTCYGCPLVPHALLQIAMHSLLPPSIPWSCVPCCKRIFLYLCFSSCCSCWHWSRASASQHLTSWSSTDTWRTRTLTAYWNAASNQALCRLWVSR